MNPHDTAHLTALEESLWRPETRFDRVYLERVLADEFEEVGRSGRRWTRAEAVATPAEDFEAVLPLPDLRVQALGPDLALVAYRSEVRFGRGGPALFAHRTSVWQRIDSAWRLRFHQGTPTD